MTSVASSVSLTSLDGSLSSASVGTHVVLEAAGVLLHAVRVPEGLVALRKDSVQSFQVARMPPAAAAVCYPPPFGPLTDAEAIQAAERARGLIGLDVSAVTERLVRAGADPGDFVGEGPGESLASYCATGSARSWRVSEAYRAFRGMPAAKSSPSEPKQAPRFDDRSNSQQSMSSTFPRLRSDRSGDDYFSLATNTSSASTCLPRAPCTKDRRDEASSADLLHQDAIASQQPYSKQSSDDLFSAEEAPRSHFKSALQEKAVSTAVHVGLRGPAAKVAGAAAAITCEGYALYKDIDGHKEAYHNKSISDGQFQERVAESTIASSGRAIGGLAGAVAGQAAIPVPLVGAVVGGVVGAACGGMHATSFTNGVFRIAGGKAKGGDDLVRCIEHKPRSEPLHGMSAKCPDLLEESSPPASRGFSYGGLTEEEQLL